jgi:anti-sigma factor RsiW
LTIQSGHLGDELQDLLDGRLDASRRADAERHLEVCKACRLEWQRLAAVRTAVRTALAPGELPAGLAEETTEQLEMSGRIRGPLPMKTAAAIAAGLAAMVFLLWIGRSRDVATVADRDYEAVRQEKVPLAMRTDDPQVLERFFVDHGIRFRTRVFDLGMMGYRLVGGRVHAVSGRPSALFVYQGERNRILVCQMFEGSTRELPRGAEVRRHGGISFFVYRRGTRTLVFWPEGEVLCVLASDAGVEEVIALAFAKAVQA